MVKGDMDYVKVKDKTGHQYILAKARLSNYFKEGEYEVVSVIERGTTSIKAAMNL